MNVKALSKISLCIIFSIFSIYFKTLPKTFVEPEIGDRIIDMLTQVGATLNQNRSSIGEVITNSTSLTIVAPGNYVLGEDINSTISIESDDVYLDLNGYTVYENTGTSTAIVVEQEKRNVKILHGSIKGTTGSSSYGILISQGVERVKINDVEISDFEDGIGINFDGTSGLEIKSCKIKDCTIVNCNKGMYGNYVIKSKFKSCEVKNCIEVGFELENSQNNVFTKCEAIEIENDDSGKRAVGFWDTDGLCNIFDGCIAQGINKDTNGDAAAGFIITGSNEIKDQILNCLSSCITFSGNGCVFGIWLEKILLSEDLIETATNDSDTAVNSVDWDPTGKYLAVGQDNSVTGTEIRVLAFDPGAGTLTQVASDDPGVSVKSVNWDPTGKYLAVGLSSSVTGTEIRVLEFDPLAGTLTQVASDDPNKLVFSVDWDPTGKYLAVGQFGGTTIRVLEFIPTATTLTQVASDNLNQSVRSVDWDPTGKYLAVGQVFGNELRVLEFDPVLGTLTQVASDNPNQQVLSVNWDPTGKYLAVGQNGGTTIRVLEFIPTATTLTQVASDNLNQSVKSVNWDPTGKYLAVGQFDGTEIRVLEFDPVLGTLTQVASDNPNQPVWSVDWDPTGKYLGVGQKFGTIRVFEAFALPQGCLIMNNKVSNCAGIGVEGDGINSNMIAQNIGYNNLRNFTTGMFNVFSGGLNGTPGLMQNISVPPYLP